MAYYRGGTYTGTKAPMPAPDVGYSDPEVPIPDPLADESSRFEYLSKAYQRWKAAKEREMGYYRAGDATGQSFGVMASDINPASDATYVTPALAKWRASHPGADFPAGPVRQYRRMNVGNVRALRRSMRRVTGFAHLAKKVMSFTAHHKMKVHRRRK